MGRRVAAHQDEYGIVMQLSRQHHVSRPTLYAWRAHAQSALAAAFAAPPASARPAAPSPLQIMTLWITHASDRGIQQALAELLHRGISLDTITTILAEAVQRAQTWMQTPVPESVRAGLGRDLCQQSAWHLPQCGGRAEWRSGPVKAPWRSIPRAG